MPDITPVVASGRPWKQLLARGCVVAASVLVLAGIGAALWIRSELRASLPVLDGQRPLPGLSAPVEVTRDALGIPTIRGESRTDVARATGFLHGQDRFFQMDLARRRAAGELSALVGRATLELDRDVRRHRLRPVAAAAVERLQPPDRAVLDAYTAGVNAGLSALGAAPFEYLILRQSPEPWRTEDSLLVVLSMFVTLQDHAGAYESMLGTMHDVLPRAMFEFLAPRGTEWDAPVVGDSFATPVIPGPEVFDLRTRGAGLPRRSASLMARAGPGPSSPRMPHSPAGAGRAAASLDAAVLGSNSWAVAPHLTSGSGALIANDMHLVIQVPNIWYRAVFEWPSTTSAGQQHQMAGVTMAGLPTMVVGSNTHVAWGFTNSYGDWSDLVLLETDPDDPTRYRTPGGWRGFDVHDEVIRVAGESDRTERARWTIWGPVIDADSRGRLRAVRWVAHAPEALAAGVTTLETARTIEEAFDAANGAPAPAQNFVAVDRSGRIGWTIYGSIPRRTGLDGVLPASWADGTRGWSGWLADAEYPRIINPPDGRIWTASARVADGRALEVVGDGNYDIGARAHIIRDRLLAADRFTPGDMLDIQLDTRALFLERWRDLLLRVLTPDALAGHEARGEFRAVLERGWTGHASPESAAYRLTRDFRADIAERVMRAVLADCYAADPRFDYGVLRKREGPLWRIVSEEPLHLLDPGYATWQALFLAGVDQVIATAQQGRTGGLAARTWSEVNVTRYRHPLSPALPLVGRWLDMPKHDLPGDLFTPRAASGAAGASVRMVVSPGRERDGILHMPTGQSGHPWSPHYGDSHDAWERGEPTPFLPGPTVHTLTLRP